MDRSRGTKKGQVKFYRNRRSLTISIITAVLLIAITSFIAYNRYLYYKEIESRHLQQSAYQAKNAIEDFLQRGVSVVKTLAFLTETYGELRNFESIAARLRDEKQCFYAIELLEKGVIRKVYPLQGNESVIGYDILSDSLTRSEAMTAVVRRDVYFAGPLTLKQGGMAIIGRMPIFRQGELYGFAAVIIRFDDLLKCSGLNAHYDDAIRFQLAKVNPATGDRTYFWADEADIHSSAHVAVDLPLGNWKLFAVARQPILPSTLSYTFLLGVVLSLITAFLVGYLSYLPEMLRAQVQAQTSMLEAQQQKLKLSVENLERVNNNLRDMYWFQSHRIRAPLATMMGLASLLKDSCREGENGTIASHILDCAEKFDKVIRESCQEQDLIDPQKEKPNQDPEADQ